MIANTEIITKNTRKVLKNATQPCCLILGVSTMTGLSLVRSLGVENIPVICLDNSKFAIGAFSRYCSSFEFCDSDEELMFKLIEIGKMVRHRNILFCESDKYLLFLDKNHKMLAEYFDFSYRSKIRLKELMDKENMIKLAIDANIDTPQTFSSYEVSAQEIKKKVPYPCFVKPLYSQTYLRTKGEIANDEKELKKTLCKGRFKNGYIVQEIIAGPETNMWIYAGYTSRNLRVGVTCYKYRQIPKDFGIGVVVFSMKNKNVEELGNRFLNQLNYTGLFCLEFKKDLWDGKYKFLEINPRISGLNSLFRSLGFNFPYIAYLDALNLKVDYPVEQKDGVLWVSVIEDFIACCRYYCRYDKLIYIDWIRKLFKADIYAVLSIHDIKPFICKILKHILRINKKK